MPKRPKIGDPPKEPTVLERAIRESNRWHDPPKDWDFTRPYEPPYPGHPGDRKRKARRS